MLLTIIPFLSKQIKLSVLQIPKICCDMKDSLGVSVRRPSLMRDGRRGGLCSLALKRFVQTAIKQRALTGTVLPSWRSSRSSYVRGEPCCRWIADPHLSLENHQVETAVLHERDANRRLRVWDVKWMVSCWEHKLQTTFISLKGKCVWEAAGCWLRS